MLADSTTSVITPLQGVVVDITRRTTILTTTRMHCLIENVGNGGIYRLRPLAPTCPPCHSSHSPGLPDERLVNGVSAASWVMGREGQVGPTGEVMQVGRELSRFPTAVAAASSFHPCFQSSLSICGRTTCRSFPISLARPAFCESIRGQPKPRW